MSECPFCGLYPYHEVDIGVGWQRVAVSCCEFGIALFQYGERYGPLRRKAKRQKNHERAYERKRRRGNAN